MYFMEDPSFIFSSGPIELKSEGENIFVEGYIATDDLDLVNDIVTKSCMLDMAKQMQQRTIKLDFEHESMRGKSDLDRQLNKTINPVAKIEDFSMDKKGLKIKAKLNQHTPRFNEIKNSIEDGFLDAFSIAYIPTETKDEFRNGQEIRLLDKVNLLNIAFTGTAINPKATIEKVFMKSLDYLKAKPKKPKPQPDPHKEDEDEDEDDEEETKTGKHPKKKKKQYKAYEKDGAHAHTKEEPLGLHNHPEIESMIGNVGEQINNRINFLSDRVYELIDDGPELTASETLSLKSQIKKEKHNHISDNIIKLQEVKDMTEDEEKKKLEEEEAAKTEAEEKAKAKVEAEVKAEDEKVAKEAEEKEAADKETAEKDAANKEEVKALKEKIEAQGKEIEEIKSVIVKPIKKSMQSMEDKSKNFEEKGINPLDMIA